jgi:hypothetical protein
VVAAVPRHGSTSAGLWHRELAQADAVTVVQRLTGAVRRVAG